MFENFHYIILSLTALLAATVNGALGYGFSSITVPIALLFYTNRILNPALVLIEVPLNGYVLFVNRRSLPRTWLRVLPILVGVILGVITGGYILSSAHPGWLRFWTFAILLPLILLQAAGLRSPIRAERVMGIHLGAGVGILYSLTTISGPPLALFLNNQGFVKEEFRAGLALIRMTESTLTAIAYYFMGLYTLNSSKLLLSILPGVAIGVPLGAYVIRKVDPETFRRLCMSFDAWVVSFGLSRVLIDLKLLGNPVGYTVLLAAVSIDACLLYIYFTRRRARLSPAYDKFTLSDTWKSRTRPTDYET